MRILLSFLVSGNYPFRYMRSPEKAANETLESRITGIGGSRG